MLIKKSLLKNSLTLFSLRTDKFKTGIMTFTLTVPLDKDTYANALLLSGLLRRGTKKFRTMAKINRRLDELYASCVEIRSSIIKNSLLIIFTAEFLDDRYTVNDVDILDGIIEIVSEMILFPNIDNESFDNRIVEQELNFVRDSLKAEKNNTRAYAATKCNEIINRNNSCYPTINGLLSQVDEMSSKSIYEYYKYVLSVSSLDVFYIGNCDMNTVSEKVQKYFSAFSGKNAKCDSIKKYELPKDFISQKEALPVSQSKLALGFDTGIDISSPDYYSVLLLNEIFGGSSSSKLFINVRERMNICYYCSSSYSIYSGVILVSCGINSANYNRARDAIFNQLKEIQNGNVDEQELLNAKKSLENCYIQIYDNPLEIQAFYGGRSVLGIYEDIDACRAKISEVTLDDIVAASKKIKCIAEFLVEGTSDCKEINEEEYDD